MSDIRKILAISAAALVALVAVVAPAAQAEPRPDPTRERADLIIRKDYNSFLADKAARPAPFDWSSDGCTNTPIALALLFYRPCQLHDFGYRNYGHGLRLGSNENVRDFIDGRFLQEMQRLCRDTFYRWWQRANKGTCLTQAGTIWSVVRHAGRSAFYNG